MFPHIQTFNTVLYQDFVQENIYFQFLLFSSNFVLLFISSSSMMGNNLKGKLVEVLQNVILKNIQTLINLISRISSYKNLNQLITQMLSHHSWIIVQQLLE